MTEHFPYEAAKNEVIGRLDLSQLMVDVEGTSVAMEYLFEQLEGLLFNVDIANPENSTLKEENLNDQYTRQAAVQRILDIEKRIKDLKREYPTLHFKPRATIAGVLVTTKADFDFSMSVLDGLVESYKNRIRGYLNPDELSSLGFIAAREELRDPGLMTLDELAEEMSKTLDWTEERAGLVNNEFLRKVGEEKDEWRISWYRTRRALAAILGEGDTGLVSFDVWWGAILHQLTSKTLPYVRIARALFLKKPDPKSLVGPDRTGENRGLITPEDMNKTEIYDRALQVYEYILRRIKHHGEFGGWDHDPENPDDDLGNLNFGYLQLKDDRVGQFMDHLRKKFSDIVDAYPDHDLLGELIKYAQAMTVKSAAFIPWLLHETTRQHGLALPGLEGKEFRDELFVAAPWSAGWYSRNRYGQNFPNATSEEMLFLPKPLLKHLALKDFEVEEAERTVARGVRGGVHEADLKKAEIIVENRDKKVHEATRLWDIVSLFRETLWGKIPDWVLDVRKMMVIGQVDNNDPAHPRDKVFTHTGDVEMRPVRPNEIDLNNSIFPMPGELVINVLRIQQEKEVIERDEQEIREIIGRANDRFDGYAEELVDLETRVSDIEERIVLLDPVVDAAGITTLTDEREDLIHQITDLNRSVNAYNDALVVLNTNLRAVERRKSDFTSIYSRLGYGDSFDQIGRNKLENAGYKPDDYQPLAFEALERIYKEFRTPQKEHLDEKEIREKFKFWLDRNIGKAKLIPGKHHLLFGPFTVRYIHRLMSQFEGRFDQRKVDELRRHLLGDLEGGGGLPWYTKEYVMKHLGGDKMIPTLLRAYRELKEKIYRGEWWRFRNPHPVGWERQLVSQVPLDLLKRDDEGNVLETMAPWYWDPVSEDTAGKGASEGKH